MKRARRKLSPGETRFLWGFGVLLLTALAISEGINRWIGEQYAVNVRTWLTAFFVMFGVIIAIFYFCVFLMGLYFKFVDPGKP